MITNLRMDLLIIITGVRTVFWSLCSSSGQKVPRIINIKEGGAAGEGGQLRVGQLITAVEGRSTEGDQNPS